MKKLFFLLFISLSLVQCIAIKSTTTTTPVSSLSNNIQQINPTKLVVGIVIDQMRYDYLIKFYNKYGDGGFKRLMNKGYNLENVHFNYIPTYTAVGHTSIYTGATPATHGIISNNWYDKFSKKYIYCADDDRYSTVGAKSGGNKSPQRILTTTITDELRLSQNMKGKTIGIAIKDRAAILPAGHTATAAYWFEGNNEGKFITSTFYMNELPSWVIAFNNSGKANTYLNETWNTYYDISTYTESLADNNPYEGLYKGKNTPTFPYNLAVLRKLNNNYDLLKAVPQGNAITTDFAEATIIGENLGETKFTDFLTISYSSTDYVGHLFGPNSIELEDTYIRLDKELEKLLIFLDNQVGENNYMLFLTADHAVVPVPAYLNSIKIPGGYFESKEFEKFVNEITLNYFNSGELIENISNYQIFLNKEKVKSLNLNVHNVSQIIADEIINFDKVYKSVTAHTLQTTSFTSGILKTIQNGYNQKLSGDILFSLEPSTIKHSKKGTSHGSGYNYDTHVPLIFYGNRIQKGKTNKYYPITSIAPTLAHFLRITEPSGSTNELIYEILE
ncbi:alkaline phosphatase [Lutibacter profundi]|uniref:Alkaline phosphatase n=1 Tax=Lutibacter profundi TaxID=1622118 RepID=A0A0X8G960_9FLAO|nr:alkaline phosphatase PafA [Lutibacter profundi]AMC11993.1 alkaline phosphatase [Lutibacter profundi]